MEDLKIRYLSKEELYKLKTIFKQQGASIDPRTMLSAAVAELPDETIVGFLGLDLVPHAGPLFVEEKYRGHGLSYEFYNMIDKLMNKDKGTGFYTFPSTDASKHIVSKLGLEKMNWEIWKKEY